MINQNNDLIIWREDFENACSELYEEMLLFFKKSEENSDKIIRMKAKNTVNSLINYTNRIDISLLSNETKEYLKAFTFLYDKIKHDRCLKSVSKTNKGFKFPIMFPLSLEKQYSWDDLSQYVNKGKYSDRDKSNYPYYEKLLYNCDIRCGFLHIQKLLNRDLNL